MSYGSFLIHGVSADSTLSLNIISTFIVLCIANEGCREDTISPSSKFPIVSWRYVFAEMTPKSAQRNLLTSSSQAKNVKKA